MKGMAKGLPSFLIIFIMISGCLDDSITSESNETELQWVSEALLDGWQCLVI